MSRLEGKVAVITGASSGIGLATAQRFVEEGAYVFITGGRQAELDQAAAVMGRNVTAVQGDVSNTDDLDWLYDVVEREKGHIDVVFATSDIVDTKSPYDIDFDHYGKTFEMSVKGLVFSVQKLLPLVRDGGSIILASPVASPKGAPGYGTYSATKAAVRSFAKAWTLELKGRGIRVNSLSPGLIDTAFMQSQASAPVRVDQLNALLVAAAALFLVSDDSRFITGIDLSVDGGLTQV